MTAQAASEVVAFVTRAFNYATDSDNRIHSDAEAKRYGFRGGLVPGVADYAYLTRPLLDRWGLGWLERGWLRVRLLLPVYDGDEVEVVVRPSGRDDGEVELELRSADGQVCASGEAGRRCRVGPPAGEDYPLRPLPAEDERPDATLESLAAGTYLGSLTEEVNRGELGRDWKARWGEAGELREDATLHPAFYPDMGNRILSRNVRLGPWIHTESLAQHFGLPGEGETVTARGSVESSFERKGHELVVLDVAFFGRGERPLARLRHTAIFRPRPRG